MSRKRGGLEDQDRLCAPRPHSSSLLSESHHMSLVFVLEKVIKLMDEINTADATY